MFKQVDHIGITTKDLNASLETLKRMGPVVVGEIEVIEQFKARAVIVKTGEVPIELIEPASPDSPIASTIEKRGEGLHHVAYRVDDVAASLKDFEAKGFRLIDQQPRHGYGDSKVGFLHPKSTLYMLTELVEREPGKDVAPLRAAQ